MTAKDIAHIRLHTQQLINSQFNQPGELVAWMGAMQSQDYGKLIENKRSL